MIRIEWSDSGNIGGTNWIADNPGNRSMLECMIVCFFDQGTCWIAKRH